MADGIYRGLCGPEDFRVRARDYKNVPEPKPQDDFGFKKAGRFSTDELPTNIPYRNWRPIRHGDRKWSVRWSSYNGSFVELTHVVGRPWFKLETHRKTPPSCA